MLFPEIRVPRRSYHALTPHDADKTASLRQFLTWLGGVAGGQGQFGK